MYTVKRHRKHFGDKRSSEFMADIVENLYINNESVTKVGIHTKLAELKSLVILEVAEHYQKQMATAECFLRNI